MKRFLIAVVLCVTLMACAKTEQVAPTEKQETVKATQAIPKLSPEEMMAKMKEAGTPGEEHAQLEPLVGKWSTVSKMWMAPNTEPAVEKGTATHKWIYGKKFIKEEYSGKWNGQPFQGLGMLGFDKTKKEYISTWTDSMGTGIMIAEGKYNPTANQLEMLSTFSCPLTGGPRQSRFITRILSKNEHVIEMYDLGPDGKEFKMMEITYKRKA